MQKAFIFDMDGVLINNEFMWEAFKKENLPKLLGEKVYAQLGSTLGINLDGIYELGVKHGATIGKKEFTKAFQDHAPVIYKSAPLTEGVAELGAALHKTGYKIGIVSASPQSWIDRIIRRLPFKNNLSIVISLPERPDLAHKPDPDGYITAMNELEATPQSTLILEDSNAGIASAKASGAYTIGLRQNLITGYIQKDADEYVEKMVDIIPIIEKFSPTS